MRVESLKVKHVLDAIFILGHLWDNREINFFKVLVRLFDKKSNVYDLFIFTSALRSRLFRFRFRLRLGENFFRNSDFGSGVGVESGIEKSTPQFTTDYGMFQVVFFGCLLDEAIRYSTLVCLFTKSCVDLMAFWRNKSSMSAFDVDLLVKFSRNSTIDTIVNN
jgi:hypothetical protein